MNKTYGKIRVKSRLIIDKIKNWKPIAFLRRLFKLNGFTYMPSSLTFYLVVSIVPLISLVLMILTQFNASTSFITEWVEQLLPNNEASQEILNYLKEIQPQDVVTLVFSSTISIYIASRGIECFTRFADHFYNRYVLDNHFIRRKIRSIVMTLVFVIGVSIAIVVTIFFERMTSSFIPHGVSSWLKYVAAYVMFFLTISALFYFSPTKRPRIRDVFPGAYIGTFSILLFIGAFFQYMTYALDRYTSIYGPLSTIVILLLLTYFCCYILFMCFYLNIIIVEKKVQKKMASELAKLSEAKNKNDDKKDKVEEESK